MRFQLNDPLCNASHNGTSVNPPFCLDDLSVPPGSWGGKSEGGGIKDLGVHDVGLLRCVVYFNQKGPYRGLIKLSKLSTA